MNRTFTSMKANVGNNIQDTSTSMATIIGRYLNDVYFDLLRRKNWENIDDDYSFSTASGTSDYILPQNFKKEVYVLDSTNSRNLSKVTMLQLVNDYASTLTQSGTVERYAIIKKRCQLQPTSASVLSIVSAAAGDTTQTCFVTGISSGVRVSESITLTGTTPVASANSYTEILSISFSAVRSGKITITSNSGAVTIGVVAPDVLDYFENVIRFHEVPSGVVTIKMPYYLKPTPFLNDYDVPVIDASDVIEAGATATAWRYKRQFSKAQEWERVFEKMVNQLIWDEENQPNQIRYLNIQPYSRETV